MEATRSGDLPEPGEEPGRSSRGLSGRSQTLVELLRPYGDASILYRDALRILDDDSYETQTRMAAYALREVLEELEKSSGIKKPADLGPRVSTLREDWMRIAPSAGEDLAAVGEEAARMLDAFVEQLDADRKTRRERAQITLSGLDPSRVLGPPEVGHARTKALLAFRGRFNPVLHGGESLPRSEFLARLEDFEVFLIDWLRPRTFEDLDELDALLELGPAAGPARVGQLARKSAASYEYFFEHLDHPRWLDTLIEAEFFKRPAEVDRGDDWIRFPHWPESRYLARIAGRDPQRVGEIALAIESAENVRVHEDMLLIAAQLPGPLAAKLVLKEAAWLRSYEGHLMSLPQRVGSVLTHLAAEGEVKAAFNLARAVLGIAPNEEERSARQRAQARISEYSYAGILEEGWPALVDADPRRSFKFLCDRLSDVVRVSFVESGNGHDFSYIWRPVIEKHKDNLGHSLFDTVVDAVRDRAVEIGADPEGLELVLAELAMHEGPIFRRIEMWLARNRGPAALVFALLTDARRANDGTMLHEYAELLRARFGDMDGEQRSAVYDLILTGDPEADEARRQRRGWSVEQFEEGKRRRRLDLLSLIAGDLDGAAALDYEALVGEFGDVATPAFHAGMRIGSGPRSPVPVEELKGMDPAQVARTLREWEPPEDLFESSPEGLGRAFQEAVAADPAAFAASVDEFKDLEPTYVRSLFAGFEDAVKAGLNFEWNAVLELCSWVFAQPRSEGEEDQDDFHRDPHWGGARRQAARLVEAGLGDRKGAIPIQLRAEVWTLLKPLTRDPDPSPQREEQESGSGLDPANLSLDSTRGEAFHTSIRYAFWVERSLGKEFKGMTSIPELAELLEAHLKPTIEPSIAIRSVYGQWFPQFVRMDRDWAGEIASHIFPTEPRHAHLFHAAWDTYIIFNQAWPDVFELIGDAYAHAVDTIGSECREELLTDNPRRALGDHLLLLTARGLGAARKLFASYWSRAETTLRTEVLGQAGWSLQGGTPESLGTEMRDRLCEVWEWVESAVPPGDGEQAAPLAAFGRWFGVLAFDPEWRLSHAQAVLAHGVHMDQDFGVYEALPALALGDPLGAVTVLRGMIDTDPEGLTLYGSVDPARDVLASAFASADNEAHKAAVDLVHLLGSKGMNEFRDLLR
jgi:hypothetical protein